MFTEQNPSSPVTGIHKVLPDPRPTPTPPGPIHLVLSDLVSSPRVHRGPNVVHLYLG